MKNKRALFFLLLFQPLFAFSQNSYKIPSENWSLSIELKGFKIEKEGLSPDSTMFQLSGLNEKSGLNLSIFIEKANSEGDKVACREYYWSKAQKSPLAKENVQKYETGYLAIVEHDTQKFNGQTVNFHSLNAYLAQKGYWIDVHLSKVGYTPKDKAAFAGIYKSIAIVEK